MKVGNGALIIVKERLWMSARWVHDCHVSTMGSGAKETPEDFDMDP